MAFSEIILPLDKIDELPIIISGISFSCIHPISWTFKITEITKMFLAQSFKKFLKENFQEPRNTKQRDDDLFRIMEEVERDCGLDPNNTATAPAFHNLIGNSWHYVLGDD